jgi:hypothetical protein
MGLAGSFSHRPHFYHARKRSDAANRACHTTMTTTSLREHCCRGESKLAHNYLSLYIAKMSSGSLVGVFVFTYRAGRSAKVNARYNYALTSR